MADGARPARVQRAVAYFSREAQTVLAGKPFAAYVVCRRYWSINLKEVRKLGTAGGGTYVDGIRFQYEGGQIRSLLSLLSYFGKGERIETRTQALPKGEALIYGGDAPGATSWFVVVRRRD